MKVNTEYAAPFASLCVIAVITAFTLQEQTQANRLSPNSKAASYAVNDTARKVDCPLTRKVNPSTAISH